MSKVDNRHGAPWCAKRTPRARVGAGGWEIRLCELPSPLDANHANSRRIMAAPDPQAIPRPTA